MLKEISLCFEYFYFTLWFWSKLNSRPMIRTDNQVYGQYFQVLPRCQCVSREVEFPANTAMYILKILEKIYFLESLERALFFNVMLLENIDFLAV